MFEIPGKVDGTAFKLKELAGRFRNIYDYNLSNSGFGPNNFVAFKDYFGFLPAG